MMNTILQSSRECSWAFIIFLASLALGSVSEARFVGLDSVGNYRIRLGLKPSTGCSSFRTFVTLSGPIQLWVQEAMEMTTCNKSPAEHLRIDRLGTDRKPEFSPRETSKNALRRKRRQLDTGSFALQHIAQHHSGSGRQLDSQPKMTGRDPTVLRVGKSSDIGKAIKGCRS